MTFGYRPPHDPEPTEAELEWLSRQTDREAIAAALSGARSDPVAATRTAVQRGMGADNAILTLLELGWELESALRAMWWVGPHGRRIVVQAALDPGGNSPDEVRVALSNFGILTWEQAGVLPPRHRLS